MLLFTHILDWGSFSHGTWCPCDKSGVIIPHIFGQLEEVQEKDIVFMGDKAFFSFDSTPWGSHFIQDFSPFDLYILGETAHSSFNLLWSGAYHVPDSTFNLIEKPYKHTVEAGVYTYCDAGCDDCGHEYPHLEHSFDSVSGILAVPKGSAIDRLEERARGNSCFPEHFKLLDLTPQSFLDLL